MRTEILYPVVQQSLETKGRGQMFLNDIQHLLNEIEKSIKLAAIIPPVEGIVHSLEI